MSQMPSSIGGASLAQWQKDNPETAKVARAGILGAGAIGGTAATVSLFTGLTTGFGLKTSAAALDG